MLILLLGMIVPASGQGFGLTVLLSERSGAYLQFFESLNRQLAGKNISISIQDVDAPLATTDLLLAVGTKAAIRALQEDKFPVLSVLVPKDGYTKILTGLARAQKHPARHNSAIYLDQPPGRQLDFIRALFPKLRSVGVMYSSPPDEIGVIRMQANARAFELVEQPVENPSLLPVSLQELLVSSEVLLAVPDPAIYNPSTIRNILLATYRIRVPLIGFSLAYVKAGALAAIFSRPDQIASQAAAIVQEFENSRVLPPSQYSQEFDFAINEQVAHSLGLNIRSEAQLRAIIGKSP